MHDPGVEQDIVFGFAYGNLFCEKFINLTNIPNALWTNEQH